MGVKVIQIRGKWYISIHWHRRRKMKQFPTKEKALEAAERIREALRLFGLDAWRQLSEREVRTSAPTLRTYATAWLNDRRRQVRRSTWRSNEGHLRIHVMPSLGGIEIDQIEYRHCKRVIAAMAERYSANTIRLTVQALRAVLTEAKRDGLIKANPAERLGQLYRQARAPESIDVFTAEEIEHLLNVTMQKRPEWYAFILTLARTGMRVGEARGLWWADIDWRKGQILVERNIPSVEQRRYERTKTPAGRRLVDMSPQLQESLERLHRKRLEAALADGGTEIEDEPVFVTAAGTPVHYSHFINRVWRPIMRATHMRYRSPHDLRHSFASLLLAAGEDPGYVAAQLGHKSIAVTLRVYAHWVPGTKRVGVAALDSPGKNANGTQMEAQSGCTKALNG